MCISIYLTGYIIGSAFILVVVQNDVLDNCGSQSVSCLGLCIGIRYSNFQTHGFSPYTNYNEKST